MYCFPTASYTDSVSVIHGPRCSQTDPDKKDFSNARCSFHLNFDRKSGKTCEIPSEISSVRSTSQLYCCSHRDAAKHSYTSRFHAQTRWWREVKGLSSSADAHYSGDLLQLFLQAFTTTVVFLSPYRHRVVTCICFLSASYTTACQLCMVTRSGKKQGALLWGNISLSRWNSVDQLCVAFCNWLHLSVAPRDI